MFLMIQYSSHGINDHGIAAVIISLAVIPHTVYAGNKTLIFDCTCLQECFPGMISLFGPIGRIDQQVIFRIFIFFLRLLP